MARIRTVKPTYPKNRKVRQVSRDARLLNIHLWNLADDEGRLQELPQWIIGEVFPTDEDVSPSVLRGWLEELAGAELIIRYEVSGEKYIECHDFDDHQVISHPRPSEIPPSRAKNNGSSSAPVILHEASSQEKEGKRKRKGKRKSAVKPADAPLSFLLADLVEANGSKRPSVGMRWADAERLMIERDGRDPVKAERLLRWCQADEFWRGNILSMPKFREKYDQLRLQANRARGGVTGDDGRDHMRALVERDAA